MMLTSYLKNVLTEPAGMFIVGIEHLESLANNLFRDGPSM